MNNEHLTSAAIGFAVNIATNLLGTVANKIGKLTKSFFGTLKDRFSKSKEKADIIIDNVSKNEPIVIDPVLPNAVSKDAPDTVVEEVDKHDRTGAIESKKKTVSPDTYISVSDQLAGLVYSYESDVDKVEGELLKLVQEHFTNFIDEIRNNEELKRNSVVFPVNHLVSSSEFENTIKGLLKNHIAKCVTLDNAECLSILGITDETTKRTKLNDFKRKTILKGLEIVQSEIMRLFSVCQASIDKQISDTCDRRIQLISTIESGINEMSKSYNKEQRIINEKKRQVQNTINLCEKLMVALDV